jgi:hypothetical protein
MGERHPLGPARGPRCVGEDGDGAAHEPGGREGLAVEAALGGELDHLAQGPVVLGDPAEAAYGVAASAGEHGPAVVGDVAKLGLLEGGTGRYRDGSRAQSSEVGDHELQRVGSAQHDPVAWPHVARPQPSRGPHGAFPDVFVGERAVVDDQGGPTRVAAAAGSKGVRERSLRKLGHERGGVGVGTEVPPPRVEVVGIYVLAHERNVVSHSEAVGTGCRPHGIFGDGVSKGG